MKRSLHGVQSEKEDKAKKSAPQTLSALQTADPNIAKMARKSPHDLSPGNIMSLQRTFGNQTVSRLIGSSSREETTNEEELDVPGPRGKRSESQYDYPGPRGGARGGEDARASAAPSATNDLGDAVDVDGTGMYGWDRTIRASDVAKVVNGVIPTESTEEATDPVRIVIFTGTHGNTRGHLVNNASSRNFVTEDQATAAAANALPGVQTEVVDVVNSYTKKADLMNAYKATNYIRIMGWCYSKRSYGLGDSIKSNWWPKPDNL